MVVKPCNHVCSQCGITTQDELSPVIMKLLASFFCQKHKEVDSVMLPGCMQNCACCSQSCIQPFMCRGYDHNCGLCFHRL